MLEVYTQWCIQGNSNVQFKVKNEEKRTTRERRNAAKDQSQDRTGKQDTNMLCQAGIGVRTVRGRGFRSGGVVSVVVM